MEYEYSLSFASDPPAVPPAASSAGSGAASGRRPAPRGTAAYPRKRANTACQVCRARRTKCDNKKPACSFCERVGAKCISSSVDLSAFDPASLKILERLDQLEERLLSQQQQQSQSASLTDAAVPSQPRSQFHSLSTNVEDVLSWPVFEGRFDTHLDLKSLLRRIPPDAAVQSPVSETHGVSNGSDSRMELELLDAFLQHVHVKNPILDEAGIRQMVYRINLEGFGWDAESCLVLIIYALGTIASSFGASSSTPTNLGRATSYFNASQKRIGTLLGNGGTLEAQCFFFSGVYLMSALQPIKAWRHFVQALACCQEFEFAKQTSSPEASSTYTNSRGPTAEESVYWACWKSELELRVNLQLPDFTASDFAYPRLFPTPPAGSGGNEEHRAWYYYLAEIALRRLDTRVRDEICRTPRPDSHLAFVGLSHAIPSYEEQIESWMRALPETMSLQTPEVDDDVLKFILRGHMMNFYELIYWPFLDAVINQRQGFEAVEEYGRKGLHCCIERIRLNKPGFQHRHHGTWFMLQSCTRSALILLAAARTAHAAALIPDGWKNAVIDVMEMLRFWEHEVGDAGDRLQILENLLETV
jgi:Fungal Zn(2)-Cys(6) binuclear cluster domain